MILIYTNMKREKNFSTALCGECGSKFLKRSSKMKSLCAECSHIIYGYKNCGHVFENGVCVKCLWDGSRSEYIVSLLKEEVNL